MHIIVRSGLRVSAGAGTFLAGALVFHPATPIGSYVLAGAAVAITAPLVFIFGWHCSRTSLVIYRDRPVHHGAILPARRRVRHEADRSPVTPVLDQDPAGLEVVDSAAPAALARYDQLARQRQGR